MLSLRVGLVFKKIFGVEQNKDLLISLINSVVSNEDQISAVQILNPYYVQNFKHDRLSVLNINAQAKCGKLFNIEIQIADDSYYDKRDLHDWAKLYSERLETDEAHGTLYKAIGIHILNFTGILERSRYHNVFHIKEQETGERYFTDFELHTVELKKFTGAESKELNELIGKVKSPLDRWMAFLTRHELLDKDALPKELDDGALKKALQVLEVMTFSKVEREYYEDRLKWLRHEASAIDAAETRGIEIGEAKGIEIGEARGIEIGEAKRIEKTALNMLKHGLPLHIISAATGLPLEKVNALAQKSTSIELMTEA